MGNFSSCLFVEYSNNTAKLIDLRRNILRIVEVPTTAAELMMEDPGHVVSPVTGLQRFSALKADESLFKGGVYVLIPISRVNGKLSESEMSVITSVCGDKRAKRRSSQVTPVVNVTSNEGVVDQNPIELLGEVSDSISVLSCRTRRSWKPTLQTIYEGGLF